MSKRETWVGGVGVTGRIRRNRGKRVRRKGGSNKKKGKGQSWKNINRESETEISKGGIQRGRREGERER